MTEDLFLNEVIRGSIIPDNVLLEKTLHHFSEFRDSVIKGKVVSLPFTVAIINHIDVLLRPDKNDPEHYELERLPQIVWKFYGYGVSRHDQPDQFDLQDFDKFEQYLLQGAQDGLFSKKEIDIAFHFLSVFKESFIRTKLYLCHDEEAIIPKNGCPPPEVFRMM